VIESFDPIALPLWLVAFYAFAMYPLGILFGPCCSDCGCEKCAGCSCCGSEWPRAVGQCCGGVWQTGEGTCCGGDWYEEGGECCGGEVHTGEGNCCDGQWHTDSGSCCAASALPLAIEECGECSGGVAKARVVYIEGSGLSVSLTDGGFGYAAREPRRIAPTLTVSGGSGTGLEVELTLEQVEGGCSRPTWRIESLSFSGGTGYRYKPATPGRFLGLRPLEDGETPDPNRTPTYVPPVPTQDTEALTVTCAAEDVTLVEARLTVTSNSSGVPVAVNIVAGGIYYGTAEDQETYVHSPVVSVDLEYTPAGLGGAEFSATVDGSYGSPTFGQVTSITIENEGTTYEGWLWLDLPHWYTEEGECCFNTWYTEAGECCNNVWYPDEDPCPEGQVFFRKSDTCCGCINEFNFDSSVMEIVPTIDNLHLVDCPPCEAQARLPYAKVDENGVDRGPKWRCCLPGGECQYEYEDDCEDLGGTWEEGKCCLDPPRCVGPCCRENDDGLASCELVPRNECMVFGSEAECETSCRGACCVDGVTVGNLTQEECDEAGGCWAGVGEESCRATDECRPPFATDCCESVVSGASGLTFTQPRRKRCDPTVRPWLVTVTGTTDSGILVHGVPVGKTSTPTDRCPINVAFLICWDKFNVEPMPCDSEFLRLDVSVCWTPADASPVEYQELLNYSGCNDITLWLGDCSRDCETTLTYAGPGVTVGATVEIRGDATIEANGGALEFPAFNYAAGCDITLTLAGTSTADNSVPAMANPASGFTKSVKKTGSGRWILTAASTYTGKTEISAGTLVVATNAPLDGNGAFGYSLNGGLGGGSSPVVELSSVATLLLDSGAQVGRIISIAGNEQATLGGANTSGTTRFQSVMTFFVNQDVLIQSAGGGTVDFANGWLGGAYGNAGPVEKDFTFGSAGNTGTVLLSGNLSTTGEARVEYGTLRVTGSIAADAGVTITGSGTELDYRGTAALASPVALAQGTLTGEGTISDVTVSGSPTIRVDSGDEIEIDDELSGSGTLAKTGAGTLRLAASTFTGTLNISAGEVVLEQIKTNPGGLVSSATFSNTTLTVVFTGDPDADEEFVLLSGPTTQTYTPTLTGTTKTGTYNASTSTLTID
jgi:autotransporter-associated beta strand protein